MAPASRRDMVRNRAADSAGVLDTTRYGGGQDQPPPPHVNRSRDRTGGGGCGAGHF